MDEKTSREIFTRLIKAFSTEEVKRILDSCQLKDSDWEFYGGTENNWRATQSQQTEGIGSLTELITNSIDAVLCRKAHEHGIKDLSGGDAPKSMQEAVRKFYDITEGKLSSLGSDQRVRLANESILIGIKRVRRGTTCPTYTIVDFGEGQEPDRFHSTFLSLDEKNKESIGFVQGKFNMGSTGSIAFCTRSDVRLGHYKLVASKRYNSRRWGWTLIKVFPVEGDQKNLTIRYLKPDREIPSFESEESIQAFDHDSFGVIYEGSVVRLYEYAIGEAAHHVSTGLYNALALNLLDSALPVRIFDFDAEPSNKGKAREEGIVTRTFSGMNSILLECMQDGSSQDPVIRKEKPEGITTEFVHLVDELKDAELGTVRIVATGVSKLPSIFDNTRKRIFYTINGQTHYAENAGFLNRKDVSLGDLQNHVVVNIQCESMDKTAISTIFCVNREQVKKNQLYNRLRSEVVKALNNDPKLRKYQRIIRQRRIDEAVEDDSEAKKLLSDMIVRDPTLRHLLGLGGDIKAPVPVPGGDDPWGEGKEYPTYLKPPNIQRNEDGKCVKELPINRHRTIKCKTDAANDYLSRTNSPGRFLVQPESEHTHISVKASLYNGIASFTFTPSDSEIIEVGQEISLSVGFADDGPRGQPLLIDLVLRIVKAEKANNNGGRKHTDTRIEERKKVADPIKWVEKDDWGDFGFDKKSGATVRNTDGETLVFVNRFHEILERMRHDERDESRRSLNESRFRICLGLLTLAVHKNLSDGEEEETSLENVKKFSSAIAPYVLSLISVLGEGKQY